jgi:hypothetical protein
MATPSTTALTLYSTLPLTGLQENANKTQLVNWLADGTADLSVGSITLKKYSTAQINALTGMVEGSIVMNSDTHRPMYFSGNAWENF